MAFEHINISINDLKPSAKFYFVQSALDYDNSKSVNSFQELTMLLVGTGANDVDDVLNINFNNKKSNDKQTIINNFLNNVNKDEQVDILGACYDKLKNTYEEADRLFQNIYGLSYELNNRFSIMLKDANYSIEEIEKIKELCELCLAQIKEAQIIVEENTGKTPEGFQMAFDYLYDVVVREIRSFREQLNGMDEEAQVPAIKEFVNNMNKTIQRYNPATNSFVEITTGESNFLDTKIVSNQYYDFYQKDLTKLFNLALLAKNNKLQEKDILDIYENTSELTLSVVRDALNQCYQNNTNAISTVVVNGKEYEVGKKYREDGPNGKPRIVSYDKLGNKYDITHGGIKIYD